MIGCHGPSCHYAVTLFDPPPGQGRELLPHGGSAWLVLDAITPTEQRGHFAMLLDELPWRQNLLHMFGREIPEPRLVAWLGEPDASYSYSGINLDPTPWTPTITELRKICSALAEAEFNSVLANLYRDGNDSVDWHSDDEPELGKEPVIASMSLGAARRFDLRHRVSGETVRVEIPPGSVVVMSGRCQAEWVHRVAKTKRSVGPRINLTFRTIRAAVRSSG